MNKTQASIRKKKIVQKILKLRKSLFPKLDSNDLWDRQTEAGFTTIPRTLSMIMNMMDIVCKNKPVSKTYFTLWCRACDQMLVSIKNESEFAHESGFNGQRAIITWRERMLSLEELGFIQVKSGVTGKYGYIVLLDPHKVIEKIYSQYHSVLETHYAIYTERCIFIGKELETGDEE